MNEQELLADLRANDETALERVIEHFGGYVAAVVRNALGSQATAEDIEELVSDVFVALWKNASRLREGTSLKPWLAVVARNAALKWCRTAHHCVPLSALGDTVAATKATMGTLGTLGKLGTPSTAGAMGALGAAGTRGASAATGAMNDDEVVLSLLENARHEQLHEALRTLAPQDRELFERHYLKDESIGSIANQTGMNRSTIKSRLFRNRQKLKRQLSQGGNLS